MCWWWSQKFHSAQNPPPPWGTGAQCGLFALSAWPVIVSGTQQELTDAAGRGTQTPEVRKQVLCSGGLHRMTATENNALCPC